MDVVGIGIGGRDGRGDYITPPAGGSISGAHDVSGESGYVNQYSEALYYLFLLMVLFEPLFRRRAMPKASPAASATLARKAARGTLTTGDVVRANVPSAPGPAAEARTSRPEVLLQQLEEREAKAAAGGEAGEVGDAGDGGERVRIASELRAARRRKLCLRGLSVTDALRDGFLLVFATTLVTSAGFGFTAAALVLLWISFFVVVINAIVQLASPIPRRITEFIFLLIVAVLLVIVWGFAWRGVINFS
nr:hypothetical protein HK105_002790 [Polyrhizophydium stewartii]